MFKVNHCKIRIDGRLFRLVCTLTAIILLAFSIILTVSQYTGKPIECMQDFSEDKEMINSFCWIHSTFTIPKAYSKLNDDTPYPGIDNSFTVGNNGKRKYYNYYRWVVLTLVCQAILCYLPRWIWKMLEGGKIQSLIIDIKNENSILDENRPQKLSLIANYLWEHIGNNTMWTVYYLCCEFLALVSVSVQLYLMDIFFEGVFRQYGLKAFKVSNKDQTERDDTMIFIFPRMTKCEFRRFGPSASIEKLDALCILPLNVINEKMYLFIWFWLLAMGVLLALLMLIRIAMIFSNNFRRISLRINQRSVPKAQMSILIREISLGDWYFFKTLGRNLDSDKFSDILKCLVDRITQPSAVILDNPAAASSFPTG